jgi:hypothetical protein
VATSSIFCMANAQVQCVSVKHRNLASITASAGKRGLTMFLQLLEFGFPRGLLISTWCVQPLQFADDDPPAAPPPDDDGAAGAPPPFDDDAEAPNWVWNSRLSSHRFL